MKKRGKWILFISILLVAAIIFGGCRWFLTWANQPLTKKETAVVPENDRSIKKSCEMSFGYDIKDTLHNHTDMKIGTTKKV